MTDTVSTDRIHKTIVIKAPRSRVWRALTNADELSQWFGVNLKGATFAPGLAARGPITIDGYRHVVFEVLVEQMVPERLFSWRWHPYAVDPNVDYSKEPRTLVVFELEEVSGGTKLTVVETGFDSLPAHRRADALKMNDEGWAIQLQNIETHVRANA
jgi:uncharacterized protein YndB with AHSA1/START domain